MKVRSKPIINNNFVIKAIILLTFFAAGSANADRLNAELTVAEPDGEFYEPGETVTATLVLTDDNDNVLRVDEYRNNGLNYISLWVSGPRQHHLSVRPYVDRRILTQANGFNRNAGLDPETGEIEINLPDDLPGTGSFTIFIECWRRVNNVNYGKHPVAHFQVNQRRPTYTASDDYLTCNVAECHMNIGQHGFQDLTTCVLCHTHDYNTPWNRIEHDRPRHQDNGVEICHECHRANARINNINRVSCYSCHDPCEEAPDDADYAACLNCHEHDNSDEWIYETHDEPYPEPPSEFDLLEPDSGAVLDTSVINLSWERSRETDNDDYVRYNVELATDPDFENATWFDFLDERELRLDSLPEDTDYWWRVHAADFNTEGTWSNQVGMFHVGEWMRYPEFSPSIDSIDVSLLPGDSSVHELTIENMGDWTAYWELTKNVEGGEDIEPWSRRQVFETGEETNDSRLQGVVYVEDRFYVTGANIQGREDSTNTIYVLNHDGELIDRFDQAGDSRYGMCDLAWDEELLWGSGEELVYGFSSEGDSITSFGGPYATNTVVTWDEDRGLLWLAGRTSALICGYDREGNQVAEIPRMNIRLYGFTYWADDPDGYPLYVISSPNNRQFLLYKYNLDPDEPDTNFVTELEPEEGGVPWGACITNQYDVLNWIIIVMVNDPDGDRIDMWQMETRTEWFKLLYDGEEVYSGEIFVEESEQFTIEVTASDLPTGNRYEGYLDFTNNTEEGEYRITIQMEILRGLAPTEFSLLTPENGTAVNPVADTSITFAWEASHDPNEHYEMEYQLWFGTGIGEEADSACIDLADTTITVSFNEFPDSLELDLEIEAPLTWWVEAVGADTSIEARERFTLRIVPDAIFDDRQTLVEFGLASVYPSPFNSILMIHFGIDRPERTTLRVFDLLGRETATLYDDIPAAGWRQVAWDASSVPSGLYIVRLESAGRISSAKALLIR